MNDHTAAKSPARRRRRRPRASSSNSADGSFDQLGTLATFATNRKIFKKSEPADYLYRVESGCIRSFTEIDNDRRRIYAFYLPGDYFGLEARDVHGISAEAVTPSSVRVIERQALLSRAARDIAVVRFLLDIAAAEMQRTQNHNLLLLKGAQDRLVDFLRDMQRRKHNGSEVELPMHRKDIADYLGLTIELVSRALTHLKNVSAISMLSSRRLILRDLMGGPQL